MPLYGNELDRDDERRSRPASGGSSSSARTGDFVGRAALEKVARDGPAERLVGLDRRGPRDRPPRLSRLRPATGATGVVTSGTQSPTLGVPIAMAYVAPADAEPGTVVDVEIREARVPARVVPLPFYRRDS